MNDRWIRKDNVGETIWMIDELGKVMWVRQYEWGKQEINISRQKPLNHKLE